MAGMDLGLAKFGRAFMKPLSASEDVRLMLVGDSKTNDAFSLEAGSLGYGIRSEWQPPLDDTGFPIWRSVMANGGYYTATKLMYGGTSTAGWTAGTTPGIWSQTSPSVSELSSPIPFWKGRLSTDTAPNRTVNTLALWCTQNDAIYGSAASQIQAMFGDSWSGQQTYVRLAKYMRTTGLDDMRVQPLRRTMNAGTAPATLITSGESTSNKFVGSPVALTCNAGSPVAAYQTFDCGATIGAPGYALYNPAAEAASMGQGIDITGTRFFIGAAGVPSTGWHIGHIANSSASTDTIKASLGIAPAIIAESDLLIWLEGMIGKQSNANGPTHWIIYAPTSSNWTAGQATEFAAGTYADGKAAMKAIINQCISLSQQLNNGATPEVMVLGQEMDENVGAERTETAIRSARQGCWEACAETGAAFFDTFIRTFVASRYNQSNGSDSKYPGYTRGGTIRAVTGTVAGTLVPFQNSTTQDGIHQSFAGARLIAKLVWNGLCDACGYTPDPVAVGDRSGIAQPGSSRNRSWR